MRLIKVSDFVQFTFTLAVFLVSFLAAAEVQAVEDTLWFEDFEGTAWQACWVAEPGTWQAGMPSSGPGAAHSGVGLAATVLNGNYTNGLSTRWRRFCSFVVPAANLSPRLRFWHWYNFGSGDGGEVQVRRTADTSGTWETISPSYASNGSLVWTRPTVDLSAYAGEEIELAFFFTANSAFAGPGWYIDEVTVVTGALVFNDPEDFESGLGDWYAETGNWEVGVPTSGPDSAHSGVAVAATVLGGNYQNGQSGRLVSAPFMVSSSGMNPALRFHHWYNFGSGDAGRVEVRRTADTSGTWDPISPVPFTGFSGGWIGPTFLPLDPYAGEEIELAFFFSANSAFNGPGWYIDSVTIPGVITSVVTEVDGLLPVEYTLDQNYPNPFNPSTSISFSLPRAGHVSLTIYNLLGQEVVRLIDRELRAGNHSIEWNSRNRAGKTVASGVYFYRLTANQFIETRKMMMLK